MVCFYFLALVDNRCEHRWTNISSGPSFSSFRVYTQRWNCWIRWQLCFLMFGGTSVLLHSGCTLSHPINYAQGLCLSTSSPTHYFLGFSWHSFKWVQKGFLWFVFKIFNWRIIALEYCAGFYHIST